MLDIKKSIAQGFGKGGLYDILKELQLFSAGIQGEVYFVENNAGYDGNDGKSWNKAFKTLAVALAASHANIAASNKGYAARNTIFCKGDAIVENLTKFAQKTDVIGVGSCDDYPTCRIYGQHVLEAQTSADYMGCHFYNLEFKPNAAGIVMTIPANQNGIEFHNCLFTSQEPDGFAIATHAIKATSSYRLKIINCKFKPDSVGAMFSTEAIWILGTTVGGLEIIGNQIFGAIGIDCDSTNAQNGIVMNNLIRCTTLAIDDTSQDLLFIDNRIITTMANDVTPQEVCNVNVKFAVGNLITGDTSTVAYPFIAVT